MKFYKYLSAALIAGSAGLWLMSGSATAQVSVPKVNKSQKNVQNAADPDLKAKAKSNVDAKAKANSQASPNTDLDAKAKAQTDAQIRNKANVDGKADIRSKADVDSKAGTRNKAGTRSNVDGKRGNRSNADINSKADIRGNAGVDSEADLRGNAGLQSDSDLGWEFNDNSDDSLTLSNVSENGIAARAGLRAGDQILSVNNQRFNSTTRLNTFLSRQQGRRMPLVYLRNGQRHSVMITPRGGVAARGNRGRQVDRPMILGTTFVGDSRGLVVNDVYENSPAHQAGLRAGDEIVCFNGWSYRDADQFASWMNRFPRGRALPMTYRRDGRTYSTRVTLADPNTQGFARSDRSDRLPPAPQGEFEGRELRSRDYAEGEFQGRRRTAMRPNFDEMTREQLRQEVEQLRRENESLRQNLDSIQGEASDVPNTGIETKTETELNGPRDLDVESETDLNDKTEIDSETKIDDGNTIKSETEVETEELENDVKSKTRLPQPAPKNEKLETPLNR